MKRCQCREVEKDDLFQITCAGSIGYICGNESDSCLKTFSTVWIEVLDNAKEFLYYLGVGKQFL